ncbi:MAG: helix-turn-helix domain-containing protein [Chitinophagaceae bacterium]|nr:helix-turn-helix domain-containing protein [Chitinophagaceae bacterium]
MIKKQINDKKVLVEVGKNIKELRLRNNWEVKRAAAEVGISRQAFDNYENGKTDINITTIYKLAEIFNVGISKILPNLNGHLIHNNIETNNGSNISLNEVTVHVIPKAVIEDLAKKLESIEAQLKK